MAHDVFSTKFKLKGTAKLQAETERAIKIHMEGMAKDRLLLLAIVTGGPHYYRGIAQKAFRGFLVSDDMIQHMYDWAVERAGPEPKKQYEELQRAGLVALKLDRLKGLARFLESEDHLDGVLDKWISDPDEKKALRSQLLLYMRSKEGRT